MSVIKCLLDDSAFNIDNTLSDVKKELNLVQCSSNIGKTHDELSSKISMFAQMLDCVLKTFKVLIALENYPENSLISKIIYTALNQKTHQLMHAAFLIEQFRIGQALHEYNQQSFPSSCLPFFHSRHYRHQFKYMKALEQVWKSLMHPDFTIKERVTGLEKLREQFSAQPLSRKICGDLESLMLSIIETYKPCLSMSFANAYEAFYDKSKMHHITWEKPFRLEPTLRHENKIALSL